MAYVVRGASTAAATAAAVRKAIAEIDPALPIYDVRPLTAYTADARAVRTFTLVLAIVFAASALILAAVGIYGVTAYAAAGRQREFGLRFALGARGQQVAALVLRDALVMAAAGTVLGCTGALAAAPLIRTQLYAVSPLDPAAYAAGIAVVLIAAIVASCIPAIRAARTSPLQSLRME